MSSPVTYSASDPATWSPSAAAGFVVGVDIGLAQDHSALVVGGSWPQVQMAIGIVEIRQFALGTTHQEIADAVALAAHRHRAKLVVDTSNNSAFVSLLAPRFGRQAANVINPTIIVNAAHHAAAPSPMPVSVGTMQIALPRWTLSKRELIETTAMELDNRSQRIAKTGDWELLRDELQAMEQTVRESGTVSYAAPEGHHDDLVVALSLAVFGARRLVALPRRFAMGRRQNISKAAWT